MAGVGDAGNVWPLALEHESLEQPLMSAVSLYTNNHGCQPGF